MESEFFLKRIKKKTGIVNMDVLIKWRKGQGGEILWYPFHLTFLFNGLFLAVGTRIRNLKKKSKTESELVYAHEPEHGTEFWFRA